MHIKRLKRIAAYTMIEMMIAVAVFSIAGGAMGSAYLFGLRSFQSLSNYAKLDKENREAVDRISRELREASSISSFDNYLQNKLVFVDGNGKSITYQFNRYAQTLSRTSNGVVSVMLTNCSLINFNLGTRAVSTNYVYDATTDPNHAKIIDLTWKTSKSLMGGRLTESENIQTARIILRKQALQQ